MKGPSIKVVVVLVSIWLWLSRVGLLGLTEESCPLLMCTPFAGGTPYAEILSGDLYPQLCNGMRLPRPLHCAQEVYDIMKACWEAAPTRRLPFYQLQASLEALANVVSEGHLLCKDARNPSPHGLTQVLLDFGQYDSEQYSQFNENSLTTLL